MKLLSFLSDKAGVIAAIAAIMMALLGTADVLGMALFNAPITGAVEISSMLLVCAFFMGMADSVRSGDNISVDLLLNKLSGRPRRIMEAVNALFTLGFFMLFSYMAWRLALHSFDKGDVIGGALTFALWPFKLIAALGVTLATIGMIARILAGGGEGSLENTEGEI